ncbi:MAG: hypothetical protein QW260_05620 [Thermoproteota archaeon]
MAATEETVSALLFILVVAAAIWSAAFLLAALSRAAAFVFGFGRLRMLKGKKKQDQQTGSKKGGFP